MNWLRSTNHLVQHNRGANLWRDTLIANGQHVAPRELCARSIHVGRTPRGPLRHSAFWQATMTDEPSDEAMAPSPVTQPTSEGGVKVETETKWSTDQMQREAEPDAEMQDHDNGDNEASADGKVEEEDQAGNATPPRDAASDEEEKTPMRRSRRTTAQEDAMKEDPTDDMVDYDEASAQVDGGDTGDEGVTRCICGSTDENLGLMIQCETCKCWQHCSCMGMHTEEDCPDVYYCEQCRPENHIELLRSLGFLPSSKNGKRGPARSRNAKETARELREARDAVRAMAEENAARLRGETTSRDRRSTQASRTAAEPRATPKRRTLNSRDIGEDGWEQIPPELLSEETQPVDEDVDESRKRKRSNEAQEETAASQAPAQDAGKRRRTGMSESPVKERRSIESKRETPMPERSRKDRSTPLARDVDAKSKHPNQYTYRQQRQDTPLSAVPARTREARRAGRESVSRSGTPLPEAGSRLPNNTLPEHLAHLAYLMPPMVGESTEESETSTPAVVAKPGGPEPFALVTPIDPAIKIRYPQKRMTLGEMRKRVRTIGEYVTRVQIEAVEREKRVTFLRDLAKVSSTTDDVAGEDQQPEAERQDDTSSIHMSIRLVEQLTRDLNTFQRRFAQTGSVSRSDASTEAVSAP